MKVIALQSGYSVTTPRPEPLELNKQEHDCRAKRKRSSFKVLVQDFPINLHELLSSTISGYSVLMFLYDCVVLCCFLRTKFVRNAEGFINNFVRT